MGRSLGRGMREFKDSVTGKHKDEEIEEQATFGSIGRARDVVAPTAAPPAETKQASS